MIGFLHSCRRTSARRPWLASIALCAAAFGCAADGALDEVGADAISSAAQESAGDAGAAAPADGPLEGEASFPAAAPERAGPYATTTERNVGPGGAFTLVRPRDLATSRRKHPVITWGNGTGASPSTYTSLLNRLASHGFVVIASNSPNTGTANEMLAGIDWVLAQHEAAGNALSGKLDATRIGASGHSQGGFGTCAATRDPRIKTIAPIQGFRAPGAAYRGSIFAVSGTQDTIVSPTGIQNGFNRLTSGPAMYAELKSATHLNWMSGSGSAGAETNEAVVAWMRVHLMDDQPLRPRFYGTGCGYCQDADWTVRQKDMQ